MICPVCRKSFSEPFLTHLFSHYIHCEPDEFMISYMKKKEDMVYSQSEIVKSLTQFRKQSFALYLAMCKSFFEFDGEVLHIFSDSIMDSLIVRENVEIVLGIFKPIIASLTEINVFEMFPDWNKQFYLEQSIHALKFSPEVGKLVTGTSFSVLNNYDDVPF